MLATSGPMRRLIRMIAAWPESPRGAVALMTFFALMTSWINWGFSLVFSAVLAREVARRVEAWTTARWPRRASSASAASGRRA